MKEELIESWMVRISMVICFIAVIIIVSKNHIHQHQYQSTLPSQFKIWSSVTFISCPICIIILICRKLPFVCKYGYPLAPSAIFYPHIFLSFCQLSRLQLAFSINKANINKSIAYPIWIFNVLYFIGIVLCIVIIICPWFTMTVIELPSYLGCTFIAKMEWTIYISICTAFYIIWDWIIVGLYIYKLYQFKRDIGGNKNVNNLTPNSKTKNVLQQISMILNKILFLTLISEIVGILVSIPDVYRYKLLRWIGYIGYGIDNVIISISLYLMLDHNNNDYFKLLTFMAKHNCLKCCCCCFGDLASKMDKTINLQNNANIKTNNEEIKKNTNNINVSNDISIQSNDLTMDIQMINQINLSQDTQTNVVNI